MRAIAYDVYHFHPHETQLFSEPSCPVDGGRVFLEDTTLIRIEIFQLGKLPIILHVVTIISVM